MDWAALPWICGPSRAVSNTLGKTCHIALTEPSCGIWLIVHRSENVAQREGTAAGVPKFKPGLRYAEHGQRKLLEGVSQMVDIAFCERRITEEERLAATVGNSVDAASHYQLALLYKAQRRILRRKVLASELRESEIVA